MKSAKRATPPQQQTAASPTSNDADLGYLLAGLEHLDTGISIFDADLILRFANQRFLDLLAFPSHLGEPGTHLGAFFRYNAERGEYGDGDIESQVQERVELAEKFEPHLFHRERPDGTILEIKGAPLSSGGFITTYTDVTERDRTRTALAESEARFRHLAEISADWFWETDADYRYTYMSDRVEQAFGKPAASFIGQTRLGVLEDQLDTALLSGHHDHIKAHQPFRDFEYSYRRDDGRELRVSIRGDPVFDGAGTFIGYRGVGTDITARWKQRQALIEAKQAADIANKAKSDFVANMSHELRTPLNSIIGFAEIIAEQSYGPIGDARYSDYAADIRHAASMLSALITDILDISKIEAGQLALNPEPLKLEPLLATVVSLVRDRAVQRGITMETSVTLGDTPLIADDTAIKQVLLNLAVNAVKFSPPGSTVILSAMQRPDGGVRLNVADQGCGIDAGDIAKVLEPFGQVSSDPMIANEGTGLGLPLSRRLAELHGATLHIDSTLGEGTTVTIDFPADAVDAAPASTG